MKTGENDMSPPAAMAPAPAPPRRTYTYTTDVTMVDGTVIWTTVTSSGAAVERFLGEILHKNRRHSHDLIVGIDTEWRVIFGDVRPDGKKQRSYRTAVLQLCVGRRCLVFQTAHADRIPCAALEAFFGCPGRRFVGVGVDGDVKRLAEDYGLRIANAVELTTVAAEVVDRPELRRAGLKTLTHDVVGVVIDKPKRVTMSRWDARRLSREQVDYACIDAYTSYEIGRLLLVSGQCAGGSAAAAKDATETTTAVSSSPAAVVASS